MDRVIFDLDNTLLTGQYEQERKYFKEVLGEDSEKLVSKLNQLLKKYENKYFQYDISDLSSFLSDSTGLDINNKIVEEWLNINSNMNDIVEEGAIDLLEYLKSKDKSLVVLTNWFTSFQINRLKKADLLKYFDYVYAGDECLKPHRNAYFRACGNYNINKCLMIGDDLEKDYIMPKSYGLEAILYDKKEVYHDSLIKVKTLSEIKRRIG